MECCSLWSKGPFRVCACACVYACVFVCVIKGTLSLTLMGIPKDRNLILAINKQYYALLCVAVCLCMHVCVCVCVCVCSCNDVYVAHADTALVSIPTVTIGRGSRTNHVIVLAWH